MPPAGQSIQRKSVGIVRREEVAHDYNVVARQCFVTSVPARIDGIESIEIYYLVYPFSLSAQADGQYSTHFMRCCCFHEDLLQGASYKYCWSQHINSCSR